jgi:protease-4
MPLELEKSKSFSLALIALIVLSLLLGTVGVWMKSTENAVPPLKSATAAQKMTATLKKINGNQLALIKLEGEINSFDEGGGFMSESSPSQAVREALDAAAVDDAVKGVLLLINSPGGTVGMSQELNSAVKRVRANKPIVATLLDVAASGGYYTAVAADKIVANKGTLTASIGVIMQSLNVQDLMNKKLGVKSITIKSGKYKDLLNPYRATNSGELALLQSIIDDSYRDFLNTVLDGRLRLLENEAEKANRRAKIVAVADGRVVTGNQALKSGLVDELGDWYYAKTVLQELVNERFQLDKATEMPLVAYEAESDFLGRLLHLPFGEASLGLELKRLVPYFSPSFVPPSGTVDASLPLTVRYANQPLWLHQ